MAHGRLIEMGQLTTIDQDGSKTEYKMALVIEFASTDEIRKAIKDGKCDFTWGEIQTTPNVELRRDASAASRSNAGLDGE